MTAQRLADIKARLAKPTPEPFASMLAELVAAVEGKAAEPEQAHREKLERVGRKRQERRADVEPYEVPLSNG